MGVVSDLIAAGYGGYRGWGDAEAAADFNATGGSGKFTGGGGGGNGGGNVPTFNFDYAAEATKAYGELGTYYDRLLRESQGDMNKVLARLSEDYDRGLRFRKEDLATSEKALDVSKENTTRNVIADSLARGLYSKSQFAPNDGYGLADQNLLRAMQPIETQRTNLLTTFNRQNELDTVGKSRTEFDTREQQTRNAFDLEQQRRKEAADLANTRGSQAYQKFSSSLV